MAKENSDRASNRAPDATALRDVMHAQSNELRTVQALLRAVTDSPDLGNDQVRLLELASKSLDSVQDAFMEHI